jgi:hypothetical protein
VVDQDKALDDILGITAEAPSGGSPEAPKDDPAPAETQTEATPEEGAAPADGQEPAPEGQKFFYFDEEELKDLPPEAQAALAVKDRMLRNRFTQKRQQDAETHRKAMDDLRSEREKMQDRVMELALKAIPKQEEAPKVESAAVARLKEAGWDEDSIEAVKAVAAEMADEKYRPLQEEMSASRLREQADKAIADLHARHPDAKGMEPQMEALLAGNERVRNIVALIPTPEARAEYLYALAAASKPAAKAEPTEEEIRAEASKLLKEAQQKKAASPTRGGASTGNNGQGGAPIDAFVSDLFKPSGPYG